MVLRCLARCSSLWSSPGRRTRPRSRPEGVPPGAVGTRPVRFPGRSNGSGRLRLAVCQFQAGGIADLVGANAAQPRRVGMPANLRDRAGVRTAPMPSPWTQAWSTDPGRSWSASRRRGGHSPGLAAGGLGHCGAFAVPATQFGQGQRAGDAAAPLAQDGDVAEFGPQALFLRFGVDVPVGEDVHSVFVDGVFTASGQ